MDLSESYIDYDRLVQNALRSVVRRVLIDAAKDGLQGDHHFFIAFRTQAEGVRVPERLIARFPEEMTIVLQHRFWGLEVHDDYFQVGLSFDGQPETLFISFDAIVGFVDPSVQFALQFQDNTDVDDDSASPQAVPKDAPGDGVHDALFMADDAAGGAADTAKTAEKPAQKAAPKKKADKTGDKSGEKSGEDNVVTLDAFRKK